MVIKWLIQFTTMIMLVVVVYKLWKYAFINKENKINKNAGLISFFISVYLIFTPGSITIYLANYLKIYFIENRIFNILFSIPNITLIILATIKYIPKLQTCVDRVKFYVIEFISLNILVCLLIYYSLFGNKSYTGGWNIVAAAIIMCLVFISRIMLKKKLKI